MSRRGFLVSAAATFLLGAAAAPSRAPRVFVATYSHLDAEWRWPLQEGLQQSDSTFRSVLRTLDAFPELRFSETSASYYRWVRETDPATFARIRAMVAAKRWEPLGGWWTEPDVNIVSGESLMRQAYYGQKEFGDHLGTRATVGFLPDSFGSSANLPAILRAQGFAYHVLGRGAFADETLPAGLFVWNSLGDSSVLAYNNTVPGGIDDGVRAIAKALELTGPAPLVWFGLGDHGGGPTIDAMRALETFLAKPGSPPIAFTRIGDYFRAQATPNTRHGGEIEGVFPGAFTNAYEMKRSNIDAERALIDAERFAVMATLLGENAAAPDVDDLWREVLLNQHHDTISGTTLEANLNEAVSRNRAAVIDAADRATPILERIVNRIPHASDDGDMIVAFNPLSHAVDTVLSYPLAVPERRVPTITDAGGSAVVAQLAGEGGSLYADNAPATLFRAHVPALGYAAYRIGAGVDTTAVNPAIPASVSTDRLSVSFDPRTGTPAKIEDGASSFQLPRLSFAIVDDRNDTWGGNALPSGPLKRAFDVSDARLVEAGPLRWMIRATHRAQGSSLDVRWILQAGERLLRCTIDADWNETFARLVLAFDASHPSAVYDIPFGTIERPAGPNLQPAISFASVALAHGNGAIFSCGNHGFWCSPSDFGVSLLRSTPYSQEGTAKDPGDPARFIDVGRHRLSVGFGIANDIPELRRMADEFERRIPTLWAGVHPGDLPLRRGTLEVDDATSLPSLRLVDNTIEARVHNLGPTGGATTLGIGTHRVGTTIDPYGIQTFRLANGRFEPVVSA